MKIGLALSGGGALGAAHIGMLEEFEAQRIYPEEVCGTSAGAIIGVLYSTGGAAMVHDFLEELRIDGLANRSSLLTRTTANWFTEIQKILHRYVSAATFDMLPIRFSCVATDIDSGEMVLLEEGDPVAAVMASAAYPGVFPVQQVEGRYLFDGGVTRNFPADIVKKHGVDFVIGSSLYCLAPLAKGSKRENMGLLHTLLRAFDIQQRELSNLQREHCDFCFAPPLDVYKWFEFDRMEQIYQVSRTYAHDTMPALLASLRKHRKPHSLLNILFPGTKAR